jgi:hypothetical protein
VAGWWPLPDLNLRLLAGVSASGVPSRGLLRGGMEKREPAAEIPRDL